MQRRLVEQAQGHGNLDVVDEVLAPLTSSITLRFRACPVPGRAEQVFAMIRVGVPDHDAKVEHMVAIGPYTAEVGIPSPPTSSFFEVHNYLTAG